MLLNRITATVSIPDSSASQVAAIAASIPANSMKIGSVYELYAQGVCVTNNGAAVNMVFRLNGGSAGATSITSQSSTQASVASGFWWYRGVVICNAVGAGTTQMYGGIHGITSTGSTDGNREIIQSAQLTAQDSTAVQVLGLYMNWASAAALGNSYTVQVARIERLN